MKSDNKKHFKLFNLQREAKGISKKATISESGFKRFFITYKENFGKMVSANMFFVIGNFPIIFLIITLSGYTKASGYIPTYDVFQNLIALFSQGNPTPFTMSLYALYGPQNQILIDTALTYAFYAISALTVFTFGIVNVGTAYILRNIAMGEPVFVWTDFWYAVKRNWKQALPFGIIDALIHVLLVFNIYTTLPTSDFLMSMMFWSNILLAVLYFSMRCYIYVQMVTFKLSVFKILKNSLIFTLLGLKRNMMALLGTLFAVFLEIMFIFSAGGFLLPLAIAFPLILMLGSTAYMKVYASYFKIKEVMIVPYMEEHPEEFERPHEEEEIIMRDDVTERERLAEIKKRNNIQ